MIIGLEGFGSVWSTRMGPSRERTAFYNTTGIVLDGRLRHRSRLFGQIRFNAVGGFNPKHIEANIGRLFESARIPTSDSSCLLLHHFFSRRELPDYYLFRVTSDANGLLDVDRNGWKSDGVILVSLSQLGEQQEAMLLMPVYSWIRSDVGRFAAQPSADCPWRASLEWKG
jgi:hypothetical protein